MKWFLWIPILLGIHTALWAVGIIFNISYMNILKYTDDGYLVRGINMGIIKLTNFRLSMITNNDVIKLEYGIMIWNLESSSAFTWSARQ